VKTRYLFIFILFSLYSLFLITIEWQFGQTYVRQYLTDIKGDVIFYAVNTSLSAVLLWATALLFAINLYCIPRYSREYYFSVSQIIIFSYLGLDDRFMLHELLGYVLQINDSFILLAIGFLELGLLHFLAELPNRQRSTRYFLYCAGLCFAAMTVIDTKFPSAMLLRLTLEDTSKVWAGLFLCLFAWEIVTQNIKHLQHYK